MLSPCQIPQFPCPLPTSLEISPSLENCSGPKSHASSRASYEKSHTGGNDVEPSRKKNPVNPGAALRKTSPRWRRSEPRANNSSSWRSDAHLDSIWLFIFISADTFFLPSTCLLTSGFQKASAEFWRRITEGLHCSVKASYTCLGSQKRQQCEAPIELTTLSLAPPFSSPPLPLPPSLHLSFVDSSSEMPEQPFTPPTSKSR